MLDVVRKEAESCDCLQVRVYSRNKKCEMSILQHFETLCWGLIFASWSWRNLFLHSKCHWSTGCHGGWTISLNLLLASFWHGETHFIESPISENASLRVCRSTWWATWLKSLVSHWWNIKFLHLRISKSIPTTTRIFIAARTSVIIVSNMIITH